VTFYAVWAQTFDMKKVGEMPERNTVYDVDGKIYSRLAGANRLIVPITEVSPLFIDALLRAKTPASTATAAWMCAG
jgi:penicillin-binding protein 1A